MSFANVIVDYGLTWSENDLSKKIWWMRLSEQEPLGFVPLGFNSNGIAWAVDLFGMYSKIFSGVITPTFSLIWIACTFSKIFGNDADCK